MTLDARFASTVLGFTVEHLNDPVFGPSYYIVDPAAVRTSDHSTTAGLIGGNWRPFVDEHGKRFERYVRPVPLYESLFDATLTAIQREAKERGAYWVAELIRALNRRVSVPWPEALLTVRPSDLIHAAIEATIGDGS